MVLSVVLLGALSTFSFGQGSAYDGPQIVNQFGQPIAHATIAICTADPGQNPTTVCPGGSLATLYTDHTLGVACSGTLQLLSSPYTPSVGTSCSNPGVADAQGNWTLFSNPGQLFWAQIYGTGLTTFVKPFTLSALNTTFVDLTTNQSIAGDKTFSGNTSFTGKIVVWKINNSYVVSGVPGYAQNDTGIHAAVADAIAQGAGEVKIPDFATVVLTTPLVLGADNATKPPIRLVLGVGAQLQISVNSPGNDAISVGDGSCIVGEGAPAPFSATNTASRILWTASANVANVIAPLNKTGTQNGMCLEKFILQGTNGATISSAGILLQGVFQNTWFEGIYTDNGFSTVPFAMLRVLPAAGPPGFVTSDDLMLNDNFDCTGKANCTPVSIEGVAASAISSIKFYGGGIQHAGAGLPLLKINGNGVSGGINALLFSGIHFETVAGGDTASIRIIDARGVIFQGGSMSGTAFTDVFNISQTGGGLTRDIEILGFYSAPAYTNFITNTINGFIKPGNLVSYPPYYYDSTNTFDFDLSVRFLLGVSADGKGYKHKRFPSPLGGTCPTGAGIGNACTSANLTWTTAFADNNYSVTCSLDAVTNQPHLVLVTKLAAGAGVTVTIAADTAAAANAGVECVAVHD